MNILIASRPLKKFFTCRMFSSLNSVQPSEKMNDWMGQEAANIYTSNLKYPQHIAEFVMDRLRKIKGNEDSKRFDLVLDAGCGNGKSLLDFLSFFRRAIGFDANEHQIIKAKERRIKSDTATFLVGRENAMPVEDNSVDLLLNVGAWHYMELNEFLNECNRVLKNTGLCAVYDSSFSKLQVHYPGKNVIQRTVDGSNLIETYRTTLHKHFSKVEHPAAEWFNRYHNIYDQVTGFNKERIDDLTVHFDMTLAELKNYFLSFPTFRNHHNLFEKEFAPLNVMGSDSKKLVDAEGIDDEKLQLRFTLSMFLIFLYK
uniref:uncharacterized protein LOC120337854 n=1 Tax=Styela clava TaxID=7725 RepID=UPI00193AAADC|nr:uncharacterized protein LOC120337854 [Styela clava]